MNEETIHNLITFEDTLAQYISDENVQKCVAFSQIISNIIMVKKK